MTKKNRINFDDATHNEILESGHAVGEVILIDGLEHVVTTQFKKEQVVRVFVNTYDDGSVEAKLIGSNERVTKQVTKQKAGNCFNCGRSMDGVSKYGNDYCQCPSCKAVNRHSRVFPAPAN